MAERKATPSAANVAQDSLIGTLTALINQQAAAINALTAKLDADAGVTGADYADTIGAMDTVAYHGIATPT
ncbi:MAG TPA: hypothetical protein VFI96_06685 [Longimicrobiaceae bacterium]|nr:hypothetical protein [Longimicrobiaceae bacterium]